MRLLDVGVGNSGILSGAEEDWLFMGFSSVIHAIPSTHLFGGESYDEGYDVIGSFQMSFWFSWLLIGVSLPFPRLLLTLWQTPS